MEFYDDFVDRFQGLSKKILLTLKGRSSSYLELPRGHVLENMTLPHWLFLT